MAIVDPHIPCSSAYQERDAAGIGGYALLNADSMEHALQLTKRFLDVHGDKWEVECELRQIAENG